MSRLKGTMFVFVIVGLAVIAAPVHAQRGPLDGLDAYIRKSMADWQVPGLAIAVVKDDKVVFIKGYGVREVGKPAPVDENTVFPLSSMTKAFTAAAVAILVDEGKLSWDDPVIKYLPWLQLPDPWVTRQLTIRDLLSHRVGEEWGGPSEALWVITSFPSQELLRRVRYLEPGGDRFRSRWRYRNHNYLAAGEVVAAVSRMSWDDFVKSRILEPLGMMSATTKYSDLWEATDIPPCYECELAGRTVSIENARVPNIVMEHLLRDSGPQPIPWRPLANIAPAGSISANVEAVAKWVRLQLGKGVYEGRRLLSTKAIEEMHTGQVILPPGLGPGLGPGFGHFRAYGFGWYLVDYHGRKVVVHGGGFSTYIAMMPEENLGVAVLANMPNDLRGALAFRVFDAYLGLPERDWSAESLSRRKADTERRQAQEQKIAATQIPGTKPSLPLERYVGAYVHSAFGEVKMTQEKGGLVLRLVGGKTGDLGHWHYDVFRIYWRGPDGIREFASFAVNPAGRVDELKMELFGVFKRVPDNP